ncbi:HAMP domain-containing sensor histidine kinase [Fulvivirgaceae bacterium BMA10]|uniref:histidine kinase n=1 Tax=Splendidivirga corallicola TaxID=3051826 RepID=A0ABT8KQ56_9BACT|nr:HAMP domain-containing sensor histidine kinase [Fulvivirgaceae bacterium BMA10]
MKIRLNSIKSRLLLGFAFLTLNIIFLLSISYYNLQKTEEIRRVTKLTNQLHISTLQLIKSDMDFLNFCARDHDFYKNQEITQLITRDSTYNKLLRQIKEVNERAHKSDFGINDKLKNIEANLDLYNETFKNIIYKIKIRGFKDYGIVGNMRTFVHEIENHHHSQVAMADILMLRRHEKDFLLRNEDGYIQKLNNLSTQIIERFRGKGTQYGKVLSLIQNYTKSFNELVEIKKEIGLEKQEGMKGKLNIYNQKLSQQFDELSKIAELTASKIVDKGTFIYNFTVIFSIILSLVISYWIANKLTKPIKRLSKTMDKFMIHRSLEERRIDASSNSYELDKLSNSFINLSKEVKNQFHEIEQKNSLLETQNEDLKNLNEELDRFIYSVAHDLKSPLSSLTGLVHLAKKDIKAIGKEYYFDMMEGSISKLLNFIKDIVDYTRNKRMDLEIEEIDMDLLIRNIFNQYRFIEGREKIIKRIKIERGVPFYTDERRFNMVVTNIISNAFQYFDPNKKASFIEVRGNINQKHLCLEIEDNGRGINQEYLPKIFDMFYRASESSKGSGLGLFIVSETVKILGGKVSVRSSEGEGTTFRLELPNQFQLHNVHPDAIGKNTRMGIPISIG